MKFETSMGLNRCPRCGHPMSPCFAVSDTIKGHDRSDGKVVMVLRHWWCQSCGHDERAIGRERMIELHDMASHPSASYFPKKSDDHPGDVNE